MPESARRQYVTVTSEGLAISGWKEIRFIVAHVQSALLGLPEIDGNNVTVHTGKKPYLKKNGRQVVHGPCDDDTKLTLMGGRTATQHGLSELEGIGVAMLRLIVLLNKCWLEWTASRKLGN
eukprot:132455-Amphidinium_carterae.2